MAGQSRLFQANAELVVAGHQQDSETSQKTMPIGLIPGSSRNCDATCRRFIGVRHRLGVCAAEPGSS
jgi:hypothetical protein